MLSKASINVAPRTAAYPTTAPWCHEAPTGGYSWKACCWLRGPEHWWEVCDWFQSENTERWLIYSEKISAEIRTLVCIEHREMDPLMPKLSCRKKSLCLSFFIFCFKMFFLSLLKITVYDMVSLRITDLLNMYLLWKSSAKTCLRYWVKHSSIREDD